MCWLSHIPALEVLGLKADLHRTVSLWRENTQVIERSSVRESKWQKVRGRQWEREEEGEGQKEKWVPAQPRNVWKCNSYFYRSTSLILWEGEIAHSFAVITFTCTLAELFMKDLNRGYVMGKRLFTNNTKSKKALKWTKKCHINLRSCQRMWTQVQRPS